MTTQTNQDDVASPHESAMVRVWSPLIRSVHWILVTGFVVAYLTEDDLLQVHTWAGYAAAGAVLVRLAWGVVGPEQDRLSHFLRSPGEVLRYLAEAVQLRSRRYVRHSPAGAVMAGVLLLSMAATTVTGMVTLAQANSAGPLAPWFGSGTGQQAAFTLVSPAWADDHGREREHRAGNREADTKSPMKDVHEFFANLTLILIVLHLTGVALASLSHRENLVRGMVTGDKRADAS